MIFLVKMEKKKKEGVIGEDFEKRNMVREGWCQDISKIVDEGKKGR